MKTNPRQMIMNIWNCITEREEAELCINNILNSVCDNLWIKTSQPQDPAPPKQHSDPKNKDSGSHQQDRGRVLFIWLPHTLLYLRPEGKKSPATPTSLKTRRQISIIIKIYISPDHTSTLYGGLTKVPNGGKLYYNPSYAVSKHPKSITGSLLQFHASFMLPGSFILHSSPIFCYKYFTKTK